MKPEQEQAFEQFTRLLRERLEAGQREYGDASFGRPPLELVAEIREELFDVFGWGWILLQRLDGIAEKIERIQRTTGAT